MRKIAILTNFRSWNDAYSLTHVVRPQAICLAEHGHDVSIFTIEQCERTEWPFGYIAGQVSCIPDFEPKLYTSINNLSDEHQEYAQKLAVNLTKWLSEYDVIFTHDWLSTGPNLPLAEALRMACPQLLGKQFFHWVHTAPPTIERDWWDLAAYEGNHRLVCHVESDRGGLAAAFCAADDRVLAILPIVDLRLLCGFSQTTLGIINQMPRLIDAAFVQIYPASAQMLTHKGLKELIITFGKLKERGHSICLLIVDSSTGQAPRESILKYIRLAAKNGLTAQEIGFSSTLSNGMFPDGLPKLILSELQRLASIFIYPSHGETFGLPLPETCLAAGVLPVINSSVPALVEASGGKAPGFGFGKTGFKPKNDGEHYAKLVDLVIALAESDHSFRQRTYYRQQNNLGAVYSNFYQPILEEDATRVSGCNA